MKIKKFFTNWFNISVMIMGIPFIGSYHENYGSILPPLLFMMVILTLSTIYFKKYVKHEDKNVKKQKNKKNSAILKDRYDVDICVEQIHDTLKSIKSMSKKENKLLLVTSFFEEINEVESAVDKLHDNFTSSLKFLENRKNLVTRKQLGELETKINNAKDDKKILYQKIYEKKKKTFDEIENIKSSMTENMLNLQYILSNLQQVEVTINSFTLGNNINDAAIKEVSGSLETFSDELKNALKAIRI